MRVAGRGGRSACARRAPRARQPAAQARVVRWRLFREACCPFEGNYVKDLLCLGRPLADSIIVDNSPHSCVPSPPYPLPARGRQAPGARGAAPPAPPRRAARLAHRWWPCTAPAARRREARSSTAPRRLCAHLFTCGRAARRLMRARWRHVCTDSPMRDMPSCPAALHLHAIPPERRRRDVPGGCKAVPVLLVCPTCCTAQEHRLVQSLRVTAQAITHVLT
jgi:hypothetical protein